VSAAVAPVLPAAGVAQRRDPVGVREIAFALGVALALGPAHGAPRVATAPREVPELPAAPPSAPEAARFVRSGATTPQARAVAAALAAAADEGLDPQAYAGASWAERLRAIDERRAGPEEAERLDADLRAAAVRYVRALRQGRVRPRALGHDDLPLERFDAEAFVTSLASAADPRARLAALAPRLEAYHRLVHALPRLRALAERRRGEPPLPVPARPVRRGGAYAEAGRLADLLAALGDLDEPDRAAAAPDVLGAELSGALARFQARHALAADGVLGPRTVGALNVPLDRRVRQVELALERWRWTPRDLGARWIAVNVPAQRLEAGEGEPPRAEVAMDVIVGSTDEDRRTPVLAARVDGIVFSPYWDVPQRLALEELDPQLRRRPGLAEGDGYFVETREARLPVTRWTLDLVREGAARLRQRPGPRNALGPLKLVMPNPHDVYLHGTASPGLFRRSARALSHGCIRVADPATLAALLLRGQPGWDRARIEASMVRAEPLPVTLATPARVLLVYATATAEEDGTLRFWPDLYGEDARLEEALGPRPSPPADAAPPSPAPRPAGVDVDEVGRGVVPDAAPAERAREVAHAPGRHALEPEVEGAALEVEAVPGDAGARVLAEERVRAR
jgi:murein L,D-transpeptidase YcbB/YkuD